MPSRVVHRLPGIALLMLATLPMGGCTAMMLAEMLTDEHTAVSLTVQGDESALATVGELSRRFDVRTEVRMVETGVQVLQIVGAYAAVLDSLHWLAARGLQLLANDEASAAILQVAVALLKSGG